MMHDHLREIGMIARALDSISNVEFKELGLEKGKYLYVVRIFEHPGIIQERVAELIKVDRTTAARAVKKLEQEGWIERRSDLENQKIKRLYVTEKGEALYPHIIREHEYSTSVALSGLDEQEKAQLLQLLKKVRSNVETDWTEVKKGKHREY